MARKKFTLPKRCPYCAHKLRADGTCRNPECVIGYVPERNETKADEAAASANAESRAMEGRA